MKKFREKNKMINPKVPGKGKMVKKKKKKRRRRRRRRKEKEKNLFLKQSFILPGTKKVFT